MYLPYIVIAERLRQQLTMTASEPKPMTMVMEGVYQVASTKTGQHALSVFDRFLCIVEALNFFSAPTDQQQEQRRECKETPDYRRPLPWIFYIPMLYYCRLIRLVICIVGYPFHKTVTAMTAVHYVQSLRRKLRYIKIQGCRMMANPEKRSALPWIVRMAINLFVWGPLQFVTTLARLIFGDKQYNVYSAGGQTRSKRLLKKLKATDSSWCSTSDLLDKFAEDDDNDPANDPDFEVKSTDLATETEDELEEDEEVEEEANSEPEEDLESKENGGAPREEQNPEGGNNENQENQGHAEGNQHEQQEQHHHQEHHHHY